MNNYTQFSVALPAPDPTGIGGDPDTWNAEVKDWVEAQDTRIMDDPDKGECSLEWMEREATILIYAEEAGDVETLIEVLQEFLLHFGYEQEEGIYFSWSSHADKARPGEFNGGGGVVTRGGLAHQVHSYDALLEAERDGLRMVPNG